MMDTNWEKIIAKHESMEEAFEAELCFHKAWDKIMYKHEVMHKEAKVKRGMVQEEEEEEQADAHFHLIGGVASFGSDR